MSVIKKLTDNGKPFVRLLGGAILLAYTYRIIKAVAVEEAHLNFNSQDWTILAGCLGIWVAYEAVVALYQARLKKKAEQ